MNARTDIDAIAAALPPLTDAIEMALRTLPSDEARTQLASLLIAFLDGCQPKAIERYMDHCVGHELGEMIRLVQKPSKDQPV